MAPETEREREATAEPVEITPELVRQVAEKVYALWLQDLKVARERRRRRWGRTCINKRYG